MIDTRKFQQLDNATGSIRASVHRTAIAMNEHARHHEIFSIFGMYSSSRANALGA